MTRRVLNRTIFSELLVDIGEIADASLAGPFAYLLDEQFLADLSEQMKNPQRFKRAEGSIKDNLVELGRLELPTSCMPCKRSSQLSYSPASKRTALFCQI